MAGGVWLQSICGSICLHATLLTVTPGKPDIIYLALNIFYVALDFPTWH